MSTRPSGPIFVLRLRVGPRVDPIKALRAALKVWGRRFGLKAVSVTVEKPEGRATLN
jgi:hypothetical protein